MLKLFLIKKARFNSSITDVNDQISQVDWISLQISYYKKAGILSLLIYL